MNPYQGTHQGGFTDVFVAKLDGTGSALAYSTYLGGDGQDLSYGSSNGIAVDSSGNAYVTGFTDSTDFPTLNPYQTDQGDGDAFVAKLEAEGNSPNFQPDLCIQQQGTWLGDDIYNHDGTDQTATQTVGHGVTAVYPAQLSNDGEETASFWVQGPAGDENWTVQYYSGTTVDPAHEVTTQVISESGWEILDLPPGEVQDFLITVTPESPAIGSHAVLVQATADLDPNQLDAVQAITTVPNPQPDLWIKQGGTWLGDEVFNDDGTNQTASQTVATGSTALYQARLYNDGDQVTSYWIQGPMGTGNWIVRYYRGT